MIKTWKQHAIAHILWIVKEHPEVTEEKELRKLISANYPFGMRQYHPYKAWCKAVREYFSDRKAYPRGTAADYTDTPLFANTTSPGERT